MNQEKGTTAFKNRPKINGELSPVLQAIAKSTQASAVLQQIRQEQERQVRLWGLQDHEPFRYLSILTEELGEAAMAINDAFFKGDVEEKITEARTELIQVAAVAASFVEAIDRGNWLSWGKNVKATKE